MLSRKYLTPIKREFFLMYFVVLIIFLAFFSGIIINFFAHEMYNCVMLSLSMLLALFIFLFCRENKILIISVIALCVFFNIAHQFINDGHLSAKMQYHPALEINNIIPKDQAELANPLEISKHKALREIIHPPGGQYLSFFPPFIPLIILLCWAVWINKKIYITAMSCLGILFMIIRLVFPNPSQAMDNEFYLTHALTYSGLWDVIFDKTFNYSPTSGMLFIGLSIFKNPAVAVSWLHAIYVSAIISISLRLMNFKFAQNVILKTLFICFCLVILSPVLPIMSVMINKDFLVVFNLLVLFYSTCCCLEQKLDFKELKYVEFVKNIFLAILAAIVLYTVRPHMLYFFMLTCCAFLLFKVLISCKISPIISFLTTSCLLMVLVSILLNLNWNIIRIEIPVFFSHADEKDYLLIANAANPHTLVESCCYFFCGLFYAFFGIAINFTPKVVMLFLWLGQLIFLICMVNFVKKNKNYLLTYMFVTFSLIHISIQIWATPNIWVMMRQLMFEYFFVTSYFLILLLQKIDLSMLTNFNSFSRFFDKKLLGNIG